MLRDSSPPVLTFDKVKAEEPGHDSAGAVTRRRLKQRNILSGKVRVEKYFSARDRGTLRAVRIFRSLKHRALRNRSFRLIARVGCAGVVSYLLLLWILLYCIEGAAYQMTSRSLAIVVNISLYLFSQSVSLFCGLLGAAIWFCAERRPYPAIVHDIRVPIRNLLRDCNTGDIILFSYPVNFNGFFTGFAHDILITIGLKLQGRVHWTHVGIVVRGTDGNAYIAEATTDKIASGHSGPGLCLLSERLSRSQDYDMIGWKRLTKDGKSIDFTTTRSNPFNRREQFVFNWIRDLSSADKEYLEFSTYRLDFFRASGKICYDLGFRVLGRLLVMSGYDFEYDCCYFSARVLQMLGILEEKNEWVIRMFSCPHFAPHDRPDKAYYLPSFAVYDWNIPVTIDIWS
mmetsp:Transcript_17337/g.22682  ORF Transcript_17337/g.22682 Transcript_17337/m.22682 type:complete len:399 (-) Transcript_17337:1204-2400(-)